MMNDAIEQIRTRVSITDLVAKSGLTVTGNGRVRTTTEHDSLKLWTEDNTWYWFSKGIGGDVFDWVQLQGGDFRQALETLAAQAGVELHPLNDEERHAVDERRSSRRVLAAASAWFHRCLLDWPAGRPGREYAESRGWPRETWQREMLGYNPAPTPEHNDAYVPLAKTLQTAGLLDHPTAKAVLSLPGASLVYVHRRGGEVVYLSARGIESKRHWNLPNTVVERQVYLSRPDQRRGGMMVVEGQADAISLGQMGLQALALCGVTAGQAARSPQPKDGAGLFVALDGDEVGLAKAVDVAMAFGPLTRVVCWPEVWQAKDANDVLRRGYGVGDVCEQLELAPTVLEVLAHQAKQAKAGEQRKALLDRMLPVFRRLLEEDPVTATDLKPKLAEHLGGMSQLNRLLNASRKATAEEKAAPTRYEYSAGGAVGGQLFEQCCAWGANGTATVAFAVRRPDGKIEKRPMVDAGDTTYVPYPATMGLIAKRVVLLPTDPMEYGDQRQLLRRVQDFIHRYLDVDPFYEKLAAYYVFFTWLYDLFETLPYLRALGDYGTGKSRFLQTVGAICYRPMFVSGASTTSPVFRIIDMFRGTLIIDEADFSQSDTDAEIMKILNVGYQRGGVVLRSEKDPNSENDDYWPAAKDVYGPKVLATRRLFTDRATESRCLTKRMTTARPRPDIPYVLAGEFWKEAQELRNQLLLYRLRNWRPVAVGRQLADDTIEPRLNQVTMALKAIIDDPDALADLTMFVRAYNDTLIADRQLTLPALVVQVLAGIWYTPKSDLFGADARDLTMKNIAEKTQEELNDLDPDVRVSANRISKVLSEDLGLQRREMDTKRFKGRKQVAFEEAELQSLMQRYGIDKPERELDEARA